MSVLIKGMEISKSCHDCPLCYDMMECSASNIHFYNMENCAFDFCTERHPDCPLVRVPEHGRLIDADALVRDNGIREIPEYYEVICEAPTIIPAWEEDEE